MPPLGCFDANCPNTRTYWAVGVVTWKWRKTTYSNFNVGAGISLLGPLRQGLRTQGLKGKSMRAGLYNF